MFDEMNDYEVIRKLDNGMEGFVWREDDGWYGEVADPHGYCQGAAWGVDTKKEAEQAVNNECDFIDSEMKQESLGNRNY